MRSDDEYFIQRCLDGDNTAFGFLVDKYKACVYALAYSKLRNFHDAEDITQEAFIKAYRNLRTLRRWDDFSIWLHAITLNLCKMFVRGESRRIDNEFIEDQDPNIFDEFSLKAYHDDLADKSICDALDSLPEMYQQVLTLYYLGGMNSMEIAKFLGIPPTTIRQRLSRARSQLKEGVLSMMSETFEQQQLKASFTFKIVEMAKHTRIQPISITKALPLGLSLTAGILALVFGIGQNLNITDSFKALAGFTSSTESKVLDVGEFPVGVVKVSNTPIISNQQMNGNGLGFEAPSLQNALFMSPQAGDTWTKKADMPTARSYTSSSAVNGKIYVIGGYSDKGLSTVEEYDPITDTWTTKADMPTARCGLATSAVNGKIYAIGGISMNGPVTAIEEYDPAKDKWTWKANMSGNRAYLSSSVVNGKIYIIGGYFHGNPDRPLSIVEEYDPIADKITTKANMPTPRAWLSTGAVNGKIYAIGGSEHQGVAFPTVEEYDPVADKWTKKADMPTAMDCLSTCVVDGKIYVTGGLDSEVYEYNPLASIWTKKAEIPTARWFFTTSSINGKIYAIGGVAKWPDALSTVEEYDTGFGGESINLKGKLPTTWGETKTVLNR